jgi:hypothetical protein
MQRAEIVLTIVIVLINVTLISLTSYGVCGIYILFEENISTPIRYRQHRSSFSYIKELRPMSYNRVNLVYPSTYAPTTNRYYSTGDFYIDRG